MLPRPITFRFGEAPFLRFLFWRSPSIRDNFMPAWKKQQCFYWAPDWRSSKNSSFHFRPAPQISSNIFWSHRQLAIWLLQVDASTPLFGMFWTSLHLVPYCEGNLTSMLFCGWKRNVVGQLRPDRARIVFWDCISAIGAKPSTVIYHFCRTHYTIFSSTRSPSTTSDNPPTISYSISRNPPPSSLLAKIEAL